MTPFGSSVVLPHDSSSGLCVILMLHDSFLGFKDFIALDFFQGLSDLGLRLGNRLPCLLGFRSVSNPRIHCLSPLRVLCFVLRLKLG